MKSALDPIRGIKSVKIGDAEVAVQPVIPPGEGTIATLLVPGAIAAGDDAKKTHKEFLQNYSEKLEGHPNVRVLSRPMVATVNGGVARISNGVIGAGKAQVGGKEGGGIKRAEMAFELTVKPLVTSEGEITVQLDSSVGPPGKENDAKVANRISTLVTLPDGGVALLGRPAHEGRHALLVLCQATVLDPVPAQDAHGVGEADK